MNSNFEITLDKIQYVQWFLSNNVYETVNDYERFYEWAEMIDCQVMISEEEYKKIFETWKDYMKYFSLKNM